MMCRQVLFRRFTFGLPAPCVNSYRDDSLCNMYAGTGECEKNPGWMLKFCEKACNACGQATSPTSSERRKNRIFEF